MEYELFNSFWRVTSVSPDWYELVFCVDADTKIFPDSLSRTAACMVQDGEIMGLCGETKVANKAESWVTMIQVFKYYISHRVCQAASALKLRKARLATGSLSSQILISSNTTRRTWLTLHKKYLLLLGEDRYLTTLMLKTFPKRKNMFCPSAVCKTVVPDTFSILLSQRRRGMELAGTLVLPAAISFTVYLIISSVIPGGPNTTIPLILLAVVLGLPGVLIVITSRKIVYIRWMIVYLLSLPVWNGILRAYAFWHFDDFSLGQTRQIVGAKNANHGDKEGEFDSSHIVMKRWTEFERERQWESGTQSRDSTFRDLKSNAQRRGTPCWMSVFLKRRDVSG